MKITNKIIAEIYKHGGNKAFSMKMLNVCSGGYGENDLVCGIPVPVLRDFAKKYKNEISLQDSEKLLWNELHEARFFALLSMINMSKKHVSNDVLNLYLSAAESGKINNWDLVDVSAGPIIGKYSMDSGDLSIMNILAKGSNFWENRIAMVSCWYFIKNGCPEIVFEMVENILRNPNSTNNPHAHLLHKAMGWMLREAWKKIPARTEEYLEINSARLPKITIRYARERIIK